MEPSWIPEKLGVLYIATAKCSIIITYSNGDSEQPWRVQFLIESVEKKVPLTFTLTEGEEYR